MKKQLLSMVLAVGLMGAVTVPVFAQAAGGGGQGGQGAGGQGGQGGQGGGRGGFNPGQRQQQMMDKMKTDMGATDDEWKVLQPKIEAVQKLERDAMMARFAGMMGGRRPRNGDNAGGDQAAPAVSDTQAAITKAQKELTDAIAAKDSTDDVIKEKLAALRDAKKKSTDELTKAQDDLKSVASVRQEAVLVANGILN